MKYVFLDTEFTSIHHATTLISFGLVTHDGRELYVTLNDYDQTQVSDWVRENVLAKIDARTSVSKRDAACKTDLFLRDYAAGEKIGLVSAGKVHDIVLFLDLWQVFHPQDVYYEYLKKCPDYFSTGHMLDLNTMFVMAGLDVPQDRELYLGKPFDAQARHNALHDARVVRECFYKLLDQKYFPEFPKE